MAFWSTIKSLQRGEWVRVVHGSGVSFTGQVVDINIVNQNDGHIEMKLMDGNIAYVPAEERGSRPVIVRLKKKPQDVLAYIKENKGKPGILVSVREREDFEDETEMVVSPPRKKIFKQSR